MKFQLNSKLFLIAFTALTISACSNEKTNEQTKQAPASNNEKVVRIATESSFKPFSYLDNQGNLVGFEIDLATALCDEMKVECDIKSYDWDSLIPSLQANKADAIMSGMSVTPERSAVVDFSKPYFNNTFVLIAKKGENLTMENIAGKTVGAQQATVAADYLTKNQPKATLKTYDKQDNAYLDLTAGRIDLMISDIAPALDWLKTDAGKDYEVQGKPINTNDVVAVAVRKDDPLKGEFDKAIDALKANGKYDEIAKKHLGVDLKSLEAGETQTTDDKKPADSK